MGRAPAFLKGQGHEGVSNCRFRRAGAGLGFHGMKVDRPDRRLPPLHMTAAEFDRLAAVAEARGINMAPFCAIVMRAVARQEAFASLSAPSDAGQGQNAPAGSENGTAWPVLRLNGHAAQAASTERNTP